MLDLLKSLKALKEQKGMSTDAIAEKSGVSRSTIVRLWAFEGEPRLQNIIDVARVLGAQLILSTDASLKAFNDLTVQPFRELLAEKENVIKAKNEIIKSKEESIQRYEQHIQVMQAREDAHIRQAIHERKRVRILSFIVIGVLLAVVLLFAIDAIAGRFGWIRY